MSPPPDHVLVRYALPSAGAHPLGNHGGFSGARLWRVECGTSFCLRAWPPGEDPWPPKLRPLHWIMAAARDARLPFVPHVLPTTAGETAVEHEGRLWELTTWMPGRADFHANPNPARLRAACTALAQLHLAWAGLWTTQNIGAAQLRRRKGAIQWQHLVRKGWRPEFERGGHDPVRPWAERAWELLPLWVGRVDGLLAPWRGRMLPLHPCLCDVWHDHVLFRGDAVSGIVDYGSVKLDHPAVDLARLLGSLVGDDAAAWADGLDAYTALRPLSPDEQALARALDRTGVILGAANWLKWLYHDGRAFEDRQLVADRLASLVRRLESWPA